MLMPLLLLLLQDCQYINEVHVCTGYSANTNAKVVHTWASSKAPSSSCRFAASMLARRAASRALLSPDTLPWWVRAHTNFSWFRCIWGKTPAGDSYEQGEEGQLTWSGLPLIVKFV